MRQNDSCVTSVLHFALMYIFSSKHPEFKFRTGSRSRTKIQRVSTGGGKCTEAKVASRVGGFAGKHDGWCKIRGVIKIDGALGTMTIEGQPTHSIYSVRVPKLVKYVKMEGLPCLI